MTSSTRSWSFYTRFSLSNLRLRRRVTSSADDEWSSLIRENFEMRCLLIGGIALVGTVLASAAGASSDASKGKAIFNKTCRNCHSTEIGVNKIGPSLRGILGRRSASVPDFNYSDVLKAANKVWDDKELDVYLSNPRGTMHGVRMFFKGMPDAQQRAHVIAYLATLK